MVGCVSFGTSFFKLLQKSQGIIIKPLFFGGREEILLHLLLYLL